MGWGKILGGILGVAAAPFTGGASLAIPLLSTGAEIAGGIIGSKAAKGAAKTQSAAADKAMQFQRENYQQQRQDFAPYGQQGAAAVGRLGDMSAQPRNTFNPNAPGVPGMPMQTASLANPMGGGMSPAPGGGMQAPAPGGGNLVTVQAPDGAVKQLPMALAQQLVSRGARIITGGGAATNRLAAPQ